jgi:CRP-like cAMP-binding protein
VHRNGRLRAGRSRVHNLAASDDLDMNAETMSTVIAKPPRLPPPTRAAAELPQDDAAGIRWAELLGPPALPRAECELLDALVQTRHVAAGQAVFTHGEAARSLVVLLSGDVAMGLATPGGTMRTERLVRGTAWLDASSAWLASAHVLDAVALTPVLVAELPRLPLQTLLDQRPALARRLVVSLAAEVRRLTVHAHELMHKDAPARLATWLYAHCRQADEEASPDNQAVVRLVERKSDIATQLGMTPETLSRLMRALSDQGVIGVDGYTVQVRDLQALRRLAGG